MSVSRVLQHTELHAEGASCQHALRLHSGSDASCRNLGAWVSASEISAASQGKLMQTVLSDRHFLELLR